MNTGQDPDECQPGMASLAGCGPFPLTVHPDSQMLVAQYHLGTDFAVEPSRGLAAMIAQDGKFDGVNPNIDEKNFPLTRRQGYTTPLSVIICGGEWDDTSAEQYDAVLSRLCMPHADIADLLAVAKRFPTLQLLKLIIAAAVRWNRSAGGVFVPALSGYPSHSGQGGQRFLGLCHCGLDFNNDCGFLVRA